MDASPGAAAPAAGTVAVGHGAGGTGSRLPLGLYVHVPFCASTCDFCAFYQEKPKRQSIDLYLDAVAAELAQVRRELEQGEGWLWQGEGHIAGGKRAFTVFFGGGTPGLLPAGDLARLCGMVRAALEDFGQIVEWSIELAPATVRPDRVQVLLEHGVTRFSLGVQSFSDELLEALGRQHSRKQIFAAFEILRANGAKNINCDLMFALPGQTREAWLTDLQTLADLSPEHISTYCLTFEEDTAMWVKLSQGRYKLDPEREADLYRETWAWLANAGYAQYEVSNFAREGYRSRHNLGTWSMGRWRGVGPSAASQWGGWRFQNPANLEGWAHAVLATARKMPHHRQRSAGELIPSPDGLPPAGEPVSPGSPLSSPHSPGTGLPHDHEGFGCPGMPPVQAEERAALTNRLLAADALIFGLRRRDGVDRAEWLARFAGATGSAKADNGAAGSAEIDSEAGAGGAAKMGGTAKTGAGSEAVAGLPLAAVEALFTQLHNEGLFDANAFETGIWRLNDEGLLLADAVGGQILECFGE